MQGLPPTPAGPYLGAGLAQLLRANEQTYLWQGQAIQVIGGVLITSIAVQLERTKMSYFYPWGAAVQVDFSGSPGTFSIGVQFAEIDADKYFVTVGTITAVNGSNVGRYDMPNTVWPKFVRLIGTTFPNAVTANAIITH